ncbi:MAG TPA: hypothetical protein VFI73_13460 [Candidatus Nitrosopolaris sp.]|nr:hypothetical protein [Candidatus Nitrosopolaris sp.]
MSSAPTTGTGPSQNCYVDRNGYLHVIGEVENYGNVTAKFVKVLGTFNDANNIVV